MAIGNLPSLTGNVASKTISITATASQTLFTVTGGYRINQLSVYRNGTRLVDSLDYTARDGSSVTLLSPATLYDVLEFQVFDDFRVADALNVNSGGTVNGNVTVIGIVSATSFVGALTGNATGLSGTPNITVGVVTATEFDISGSSNTLNAGGLSVGIATATTFVGALTGNATGLSGTPNITVNNVVAAAGTFTNLTVNGTQTIINTTSLEITDKNIGIGSTSSPTDALADGSGITIYGTTNKTLTFNNTKKGFETNVAWATTDTRLISVAEKLVRVDGNTVSLVYNTTGANIGFATNPSGNITLAVTGIPTSSDFDNHVITFSVFVNQTGTARSCTAVTLNGVTPTIKFAGGSLSAAISGVTTTSGFDIYSFTGINTVGSASTTANYAVLGVVNGGFR